MRIHIIGGGPAGLYLGILMKKQDSRHKVLIQERNQPGDTFGWGVVFSDQTLGKLEEADPESMQEIRANFAWWNDIDVFVGNAHIQSTGHGFCGLSRVRLLEILSRRARALGCQIAYGVEVESPFQEADLVVASDGVNSRTRGQLAEFFQPEIDARSCRFLWLGTTLPLSTFTFVFRETEFGLFQVHAYPFEKGTSTWIVECQEETFKRAGLGGKSETETLAFFEQVFASDLKGHPLLGGRSGGWRRFPNIRNARWYHKNIVILGDAAHTAHFSIGSGTKLAMEDAIVLADVLKEEGEGSIAEKLVRYDERRRPEVERLQKSAQTSLEWFENSSRYLRQDPLSFTFNLMTRSKRITYDELEKRDPRLVGQVRAQFAVSCGVDSEIPPAFTPYTLQGVTLPNRIVVSPMCQYSAIDGLVGDWHLVHLGSRAIGGAGLVIGEATAISPEGRITLGCAGIYREEHIGAWRRIVDFVHANSAAKIGLQLSHSGRKGSCTLPWEGGEPLKNGWGVVGPVAKAYDAISPVPRALTEEELDGILADYRAATLRAKEAGFDWLEIHMAHGYLLSTFVSPLTNLREDGYGGENRLRFPLEVIGAVRACWQGPISVRISATEWAPGGLSDADRAFLGRAFKNAGADMITASGGGVVPWGKPVYGRMFQVQFAEQIRYDAGIPTMAVGNIQDVDQINTIVAAGRADLCAVARGHLSDPVFSQRAAARYNVDMRWPVQYLAAKPVRKKG